MIKHFLTCPFSGSNLIAKLMKMQLMEEDDDLAYGASPDDEDKPMADGRPAWMRTLHTSVSTWMSLIPKVKKILRSVFQNVVIISVFVFKQIFKCVHVWQSCRFLFLEKERLDLDNMKYAFKLSRYIGLNGLSYFMKLLFKFLIAYSIFHKISHIFQNLKIIDLLSWSVFLYIYRDSICIWSFHHWKEYIYYLD